MSDIKMGELPIMVRLELEDLGDDYRAIPEHLNTMQARIVELEKTIAEMRAAGNTLAGYVESAGMSISNWTKLEGKALNK